MFYAYNVVSGRISEAVMSSMTLFLALLFGGIAIWVGITLMKGGNKPAPRPRPRAVAQAPADPWDAEPLRRGERD